MLCGSESLRERLASKSSLLLLQRLSSCPEGTFNETIFLPSLDHGGGFLRHRLGGLAPPVQAVRPRDGLSASLLGLGAPELQLDVTRNSCHAWPKIVERSSPAPCACWLPGSTAPALVRKESEGTGLLFSSTLCRTPSISESTLFGTCFRRTNFSCA